MVTTKLVKQHIPQHSYIDIQHITRFWTKGNYKIWLYAIVTIFMTEPSYKLFIQIQHCMVVLLAYGLLGFILK